MEVIEYLQDFPNYNGFSRKSIVKLFAYYLRKQKSLFEFSSKDIQECFILALMKKPTNMNVILQDLSKGKNSPFIEIRKGKYSLSIDGVKEVEEIKKTNPDEFYANFVKDVVPYLKRLISQVNDPDRRVFLAEAIACIGVSANRATIILTWIATIDFIHEYIFTKKLADFNAALKRRQDKLSKMVILNKIDLSEIKDSMLFEIARSAQIIDNDVKKVLDEKLGIRNSAAHPAEIDFTPSKVIAYIEDLVLNIFIKYQQ